MPGGFVQHGLCRSSQRPGGQTNLFNSTATVDLGFIESRTFTVPSTLANGDYYIMWEIDSTGIIDEWNESDNLTRSRVLLRITDCRGASETSKGR